jgi:hypothetical protein
MKKTLWTFGDSFTESLSDNNADWVQKYIEWKGYIPKVYGEVMAERMEIKLVNMGKGGSDNYSIFQSICDSVHNIKSDDIILVGWSSTTRFRLVNKLNSWKHIIPNFDRNQRTLENISQSTIDEILVNRTHNLYIEEVRSWLKLLNYTFSNNTIIHWSALEYTAAHNYFRNLPTIRLETNGEIDDNHYCEEGHIQLANEFMKMLSENRTRRLM